MKNGKTNTILHQIVNDLEKYAILHFQKEDFFFRRFNYTETENHLAEHQFFIDKITTLKKNLKSENFMLSIDLMNFMKDWIEHHILVVDKLYSDCFRQNGLK
jgi:hemerythrin